MNWDAINAVAQVFGAVGTIGAVCLALFLQVVLVKRRKPELSLDFSPDLSREDALLMEHPDDFSYYLRFKVRARKGRAMARDVEVMLLKVVRPSDTPWRGVVPSLQLKWSDVDSERLDIPAGAWRRVDILHYWAERSGESRRLLLPALKRPYARFPPSKRHHLVDAGQYSFFVSVTGDGLDTKVYKIQFNFDPGPAVDSASLRSQISSVSWSALDLNDLDLL